MLLPDVPFASISPLFDGHLSLLLATTGSKNIDACRTRRMTVVKRALCARCYHISSARPEGYVLGNTLIALSILAEAAQGKLELVPLVPRPIEENDAA
jgi:hypothetical protein